MDGVPTEIVNGLMTLMASSVMIFVVFLPFLAIPYVFIKMGGIISGFAKMATAPLKAGKYAASRAGKKATDAAIGEVGQRGKMRMSKWAAKDPKGETILGQVGGWRARNDSRRANREAIIKRNQDAALLERMKDPEYALKVAMGNEKEAARLQDHARNEEKKQRDARVEASRVGYRNHSSGYDSSHAKKHGLTRDAFAEGSLSARMISAAEKRDDEDFEAAYKQVITQGEGGREAGAAALDYIGRTMTFDKNNETDKNFTDSFFNTVSVDSFESMVGKQGEAAKGGFVETSKDAPTVKWSPGGTGGGLSGVNSTQLSTQDFSSIVKNFDSIPIAQAEAIFDHPERYKIDNAYASALLYAKVKGATSPPPEIIAASAAGAAIPDHLKAPASASNTAAAPPPASTPPREVNVNVQGVQGASGTWEQRDSGLVIPKDTIIRPK